MNSSSDIPALDEEAAAALEHGQYRRVRGVPERPENKETDIYITRNSSAATYVRRIRRLLHHKNLKQVTVHGLGAAMEHTVRIALRIKEFFGDTVQISPRTSSEVVVDSLEPVTGTGDHLDPSFAMRIKSAIHITIKRTTSAP